MSESDIKIVLEVDARPMVRECKTIAAMIDEEVDPLDLPDDMVDHDYGGLA